jgi:hypothetical protein
MTPNMPMARATISHVCTPFGRTPLWHGTPIDDWRGAWGIDLIGHD